MPEIAPLLTQLFLYLAIPMVAGYATVFGYHWYQYGTENRHASVALAVFLIGAGLCLVVMFIASQYVGG